MVNPERSDHGSASANILQFGVWWNKYADTLGRNIG